MYVCVCVCVCVCVSVCIKLNRCSTRCIYVHFSCQMAMTNIVLTICTTFPSSGPPGTKKYTDAFQGYINQEQSLNVHEFGE